jgi:hypothetical protein
MPKVLLTPPPTFSVAQLDFIFSRINALEIHFNPQTQWDQARVAACAAYTQGQRDLLDQLSNLDNVHAGQSRALNEHKP